jgi:fumarate hydratase, class I
MIETRELELTDEFVELIRRAPPCCPPDMERALEKARTEEAPGSAAESALTTILQNVEMAREKSTPICQDTGTPIFEVYYPPRRLHAPLEAQIRAAAAIATQRAYLRPNAVDSLTGKNSGDNTGEDFPTIHFPRVGRAAHPRRRAAQGRRLRKRLCPVQAARRRAESGRDLEGVRRVVLDAVMQAQGKGCAPAVLGIAIGGDRGSGYIKAKQQLLRPLEESNPEPELAAFEERLYEEANELGIGPMGFGGKTTVLGVKVGAQHRLPACYFVSIAYMCWANRRAALDVALNGGPLEVTYG